MNGAADPRSLLDPAINSTLKIKHHPGRKPCPEALQFLIDTSPFGVREEL
jgi:hypothetical protein